MNLADFILEVAANYDRADGVDTPTQNLLRQAPDHLAEHIHEGISVIGSGGHGLATFTPWVGFFDPDETSSPQYGVYLVYLFSENLERVTLTLNQGMERLRKEHGNRTAREVLRAEALAIRALLDAKSLDGLELEMNLGSKGERQLAYEAGNIISTFYDTGSLPPEVELQADLSRFLGIYRIAVETRQGSLMVSSDRGISGMADPTVGGLLADFRPKDATDYTAHLAGRTLTKSRTHERLVREFGDHAISRGFLAETPHPCDLTLRMNGDSWLVEAKVLYNGNATDAVRAAIGQLFTYRHFLYVGQPPPLLVALFSEPVGDAYCELLESLSIAAVWKEEGEWRGSSLVPESLR